MIPSTTTPRGPAAVAAPDRWALAGLALISLLSSLGSSIANVALPSLVEAFDAPFAAVQWVVLAYLLAVTVLVVSAGRLGDLFGRRRLMLGGIGLFTLASIACGVASELWILIAARAAQGTGAAIMLALAMALVADTVARERVGRAMGFLGTTSAVGTALGPAVGGVLVDSFGWPSIFLLNLPLGLFALALAYRFLPPDPIAGSRARFDLLGSALLALTLAAYALSMTLGHDTPRAAGIGLLCIALCGAGLFVLTESRARSPLLRIAVFRNPSVSSGFVISGLIATVAMTTLVVGPFYLTGALGLGPAAVGMTMATGPLVAALVAVPAGRSVDRYGPRRVTITGLSTMLVGCSGLACVPVSMATVGYVLPLVVTTAGFAMFQAANNTAVMTAVQNDQRGVVSGLLNLSRNLGLITGASAMATIFAWGTRATHIANAEVIAVIDGTHAAFTVAAVLVGVALLIATRAGATR